MFIIKITYKVGLDKMDEHRAEHLIYLDKFYEQKKLLCSGRQNPPIGGVIIAIMNGDEIDNFIKNDPFYVYDLANYDITEFTPNKMIFDSKILT
jgi:uncharacterized protein YciI